MYGIYTIYTNIGGILMVNVTISHGYFHGDPCMVYIYIFDGQNPWVSGVDFPQETNPLSIFMVIHVWYIYILYILTLRVY